MTDEYEKHARSNEDMRDSMDGSLNEPKAQSTEHECRGCDNCSCGKRNNVQSTESNENN